MPHYSLSQGSPHTDLASLFADGVEYCFLVGSGVSLDSPSSQPTGMQFSKAVLEDVLPSEKHQLIGPLTNPEAPPDASGVRFLRFEQLMQAPPGVGPRAASSGRLRLERTAERQPPRAREVRPCGSAGLHH